MSRYKPELGLTLELLSPKQAVPAANVPQSMPTGNVRTSTDHLAQCSGGILLS